MLCIRLHHLSLLPLFSLLPDLKYLRGCPVLACCLLPPQNKQTRSPQYVSFPPLLPIVSHPHQILEFLFLLLSKITVFQSTQAGRVSFATPRRNSSRDCTKDGSAHGAVNKICSRLGGYAPGSVYHCLVVAARSRIGC